MLLTKWNFPDVLIKNRGFKIILMVFKSQLYHLLAE